MINLKINKVNKSSKTVKTSAKSFKILATIMLAFVFTLFGSSLLQLSNVLSSPNLTRVKNVQASEQNQSNISTYLKSPSLIQADGNDSLFVADSYTKLLTVYSLNTKTSTLTSSWSADIVQMQYIQNNLYCLINENGTNVLYHVNPTTLQKTALTHSQNSKIASFTVSQSIEQNTNIIYLYTTSPTNEPNCIDIKLHNLQPTVSTQLTHQQTISSAVFNYSNITQLFVLNNNLCYATQADNSNSTLHTFTKSSQNEYTSTPLNLQFTSPVRQIAVLNNNALAITSSNTLVLNAQSSEIETLNLKEVNLTSICTNNSDIYLSDCANQKIYKLNQETNSADVFLQNVQPTPSVETANSHLYIQVNEEAKLYVSPFATLAKFTVAKNTHLTVIAQDHSAYHNYYYCLYTANGTNHYLYLPKSTAHTILPKTTVSIPAKVLGSISCNLHTLPSHTADNINQTLEQVEPQSNVVQVVAQVVRNSSGEDYYVIQTPSGNTGYIRYTQVTTTYTQITTKKEKCNGRTKRDTTIFISPSSDSQIVYSDEEIAEFSTITISGNTRIKLLEKINAGKTYTKVTYQTEHGDTYTGYIKTADIKADTLTPLQIIGIVLVAVNIILLVIILLIKKGYIGKTKPTSSSNNSSSSASSKAQEM